MRYLFDRKANQKPTSSLVAGLFFALILSSLSLGFSSLSFAKGNEGTYAIEVLIFSQNPGSASSEKPGPAYIFKPLNQAALQVGEAPTWQQLARLNNASPNLLAKSRPVDKSLTRQARAIQQSSNYRLLFHEAWQMRVVGANRSISLALEGGDYYSSMPELFGQLTISVERYLHLNTALYLNSFVKQVSAPAPNLIRLNELNPANRLASQVNSQLSQLVEGNFVIKDSAKMEQRRRMRSSELHFIDSPYFGLLITIERLR